MIAGMITNGYLLTADRIKRLNRAGLDHLQISIDNVMPDDVSKKRLKVLDKKLQLLAEHAEFHVNINSVVGGGIRNPHDALVVGRRAVQLGFTSTIGIIHDGDGQLQPLGDDGARSLPQDEEAGRRSITRASTGSRTTSPHGKPNDWRCRAGARYLYICEDGLVHYCSQQRGYPGHAAVRSTRWTTFAASSVRRRAARRTAPSRACTRCRTWISGALRRRCIAAAAGIGWSRDSWCRSSRCRTCSGARSGSGRFLLKANEVR